MRSLLPNAGCTICEAEPGVSLRLPRPVRDDCVCVSSAARQNAEQGWYTDWLHDGTASPATASPTDSTLTECTLDVHPNRKPMRWHRIAAVLLSGLGRKSGLSWQHLSQQLHRQEKRPASHDYLIVAPATACPRRAHAFPCRQSVRHVSLLNSTLA